MTNKQLFKSKANALLKETDKVKIKLLTNELGKIYLDAKRDAVPNIPDFKFHDFNEHAIGYANSPKFYKSLLKIDLNFMLETIID